MNVTLSRLGLAGLLCAFALTLVPIYAAADTQTDDAQTFITYPVSDLPVWRYGSPIKTKTGPDGIVRHLEPRPSGEPSFDPTLLIAVIKSSMSADAWDDAAIVVHEKTASLVVRQTRAGHRKVADLLISFRAEYRDEQEYGVEQTEERDED